MKYNDLYWLRSNFFAFVFVIFSRVRKLLIYRSARRPTYTDNSITMILSAIMMTLSAIAITLSVIVMTLSAIAITLSVIVMTLSAIMMTLSAITMT